MTPATRDVAGDEIPISARISCALEAVYLHKTVGNQGCAGAAGLMMQAHEPLIVIPRGTLLKGGRYLVQHELNRGGTAVVYAAQDLLTGQRVALKVLNGPDRVPLKVVEREINFSSNIHHENLVKLLDVFAEENRQLVIVWELISGPDLLDLLNECKNCLAEDMACFMFVQLLRAVLFMHTNGFCHRDIKPENCMVQRNSLKLKLIDFGLSKHIESVNTLGVGTPDYMCPELLVSQVGAGAHAGESGIPGGVCYQQTSGGFVEPKYDARAVDAWAMGVLMFLLVTGKYPFEDPAYPNNLSRTIGNVLIGHMRPFPAHVSTSCRTLIYGLLRKDPKDRISLTELAREEWLISKAKQYAMRTTGSTRLVDIDLDDSMAVSPRNVEDADADPQGRGAHPPAAPVPECPTQPGSYTPPGSHGVQPGNHPPPKPHGEQPRAYDQQPGPRGLPGPQGLQPGPHGLLSSTQALQPGHHNLQPGSHIQLTPPHGFFGPLVSQPAAQGAPVHTGSQGLLATPQGRQPSGPHVLQLGPLGLLHIPSCRQLGAQVSQPAARAQVGAQVGPQPAAQGGGPTTQGLMPMPCPLGRLPGSAPEPSEHVIAAVSVKDGGSKMAKGHAQLRRVMDKLFSKKP